MCARAWSIRIGCDALPTLATKEFFCGGRRQRRWRGGGGGFFYDRELVKLEQYAKNLAVIYERLAPRAKTIVWATTTPCPNVTTSMGRTDARVQAYNAAALSALTAAAARAGTKLVVDDLYGAVIGYCGKDYKTCDLQVSRRGIALHAYRCTCMRVRIRVCVCVCMCMGCMHVRVRVYGCTVICVLVVCVYARIYVYVCDCEC